MAVSTKSDKPTNGAIDPVIGPIGHTEAPAGIGLAERIESVKAGLFGALAAGCAAGVVRLVNGWLLAPHVAVLAVLQPEPNLVAASVSGAIALLSGFLFGVTYRYVIRQDHNPHLRSGAVLAFGLVRALAQIDTGWTPLTPLLPFIVLGLESLLLFAAARILLDWAICQRWVKPFTLS